MTPAELGRAKHEILDLLRARSARPARDFARAGCTCPDYYDGRAKWCKHIAALGIIVVTAAETKPGAFLDSMGVNLAKMVDDDVVIKKEGVHPREASTAAAGDEAYTVSKPAKRPYPSARAVPLGENKGTDKSPLVLE